MNDTNNNKNEEIYGSSEEFGSSLDPVAAVLDASGSSTSSSIGSTPSNIISTTKTFSPDCSTETKTASKVAQKFQEDRPKKIIDMFNNHQRILGRNLNGTIAMTTQPSNESELQLYRVLQRANLLAYYDTFICQGGDDVQQLYEAGEEEFLEIMALVGMAAKPLHVRRLQKALHEWATNPALFQSPLVPPFQANPVGPSIVPPGGPSSGQGTGTASTTSTTRALIGPNGHQQSSPHRHHNNNSPSLTTATTTLFQSGGIGNQSTTSSPSQFPNASNINEYSQPCSPSSMTQILMDTQIQRLAEAADTLVKALPPSILDLKPPLMNNNNGNKKRIVKEIENIMAMSDDDPRRMDEIRKYAAIYGRFDCKRKPEKPLTLHEVSVNEAAAQICSKIPTLLYRRDELFPLARQVVRDSGYQYSKGHSRSQSCRIVDDHHSAHSGESSVGSGSKRIRLDVSSSPGQESKTSVHEEDRKRRHDRLEGIVDQLKSLGNKQEEIKSQIKDANERQNFQEVTELQNELDLINDHQMQLVNEKSELEQQQQKQQEQQQDSKSSRNSFKLESDKTETEDTDSQFSMYSNESTPSLLQDSHSLPSVNELAGMNTSTTNTTNSNIENVSSKSSKKKNNNQQTNNDTSNNGLSTSVLANMVNSNSNDSMDFGKQLNEVIDEGLRLMGHVMEENIDLRLFNKYTEVLRNNGATTSSTATPETSPNSNVTGNFRSHKNEQQAGQQHRQRGRPPKSLNSNNTSNSDRDLQTTFYEQLLSQAQIQQQMQLYQQSLYAQALFGDFNVTAAAAGLQTTTGNENNFISNDSISAGPIKDQETINSSSSGQNSSSLGSDVSGKNNMENNLDRDEIVQSLNALISMSNNNRQTTMDAASTIKPDLNSSVEFKIA